MLDICFYVCFNRLDMMKTLKRCISLVEISECVSYTYFLILDIMSIVDII